MYCTNRDVINVLSLCDLFYWLINFTFRYNANEDTLIKILNSFVMKRILILILTLALSFPVFSQIYLDGRKIDRIVRQDYILIYLTRPFCRTRAFYKVPGKCSLIGNNRIPVTDSLGRPLFFDSLTAVVELFEENGWIFRQTIDDVNNSSTGFNQSKTYLLFQRKEIEEADGGN